MQDPGFKRASNDLQALFDYIDAACPDYIGTLIGICEVPAPTFAEKARAQHVAALFRQQGFDPVIDAAGNVRVCFSNGGSPHVVLSAHLDTVFPFGEVRVKQNGSVLHAPGISDDSSGVAAILFLSRALRETAIPLQGSLTLLATVGEEGLGNLCGCRFFFEDPDKPVDYFISLDGSDAERLVTVALASKRARITFTGPGGHSWGDAGVPNPIHACGGFLNEINQLELPETPKSTINVGVISGGTSVNTIPTDVSLDIDVRSESVDALQWLWSFVKSSVHAIGSKDKTLTAEVQVLGERPAGCIDVNHKLVQTALAANHHFGLNATFDTGSTDANIPFALGIPSLAFGVGGKSGKIHTPEEWYDTNGVETGLKRTALLLIELLNE